MKTDDNFQEFLKSSYYIEFINDLIQLLQNTNSNQIQVN